MCQRQSMPGRGKSVSKDTAYKKTPWQETGTGNSKNKKQRTRKLWLEWGSSTFELSGSAGSLGFLWRATYILRRQACMLSKRIKKDKQCFVVIVVFHFFLAVLGMSAGFMHISQGSLPTTGATHAVWPVQQHRLSRKLSRNWVKFPTVSTT